MAFLFAEASFKVIWLFYAGIGTAAPIVIAVLVFGWNIRRGVNKDVDEKIKEVKVEVGKKLDIDQFKEYKSGHATVHIELKDDVTEVKEDVKYLVRREKKKEKNE